MFQIIVFISAINLRISKIYLKKFHSRVIVNSVKFVSILLLFLFISGFSVAQNEVEIQKQLKFRHITIDDGLSSNHVNSICQDSLGYIWIATLNGLNRYNGMSFKNYYANSNNPFSLPSNDVFDVYCDSNGKLWAGTNNGICYYDESADGFEEIELVVKNEAGLNVFDMEEDFRHNLWLATSSGLIVYSLDNKEVSKIFTKKTENLSLPSDTVYCLMVDKNENLWFSCYNKGLCFLNPFTGYLKCFLKNDHQSGSVPDNRITDIFQDKSGKIWFSTYSGGICYLNSGDSTFTTLTVDVNNAYSSRVRTIVQDNEDNIYIGTRGGLYLYHPETNHFNLYADSKHKFSTLTNNSVICSFTDKNNGLWLGTYYGGVNFADLDRKPFVHFTADENDHHFLNSKSVFAFARDLKGKLYIGTEEGLNVFDKKNNTFTYYVHDPKNPNSLAYNDIKSLAFDQQGNLWIGTNLGGLDYFYPNTGKFKHYKHRADDSTSLLSDKIYNLHVDRNNDLWVISSKDWDELPSRLSYLKNGSSKFKHFSQDFYDGIFETSAGDLRIGGMGGFWLYNHLSGEFSFIGNDLLIGKVYCVYEDSKGNVWAGSTMGLVRYDVKDKRFYHFSTENGFPFTMVYGILEDDYLNIWISTNAGLMNLVKAVVLTDAIKPRVYGTKDGIQSKEFNYNAYFESSDGQFYFGGINGFNSFYPEKIKDNTDPPEIVISDLLINNISVKVDSQFNGRIILTKPISKTKRIVLKKRDKLFTIKFDALHYSNPERNTYKYMLVGFDEDYTSVNAYNNYVTYTDLPSGNYTFKVFAANYDGVKNDIPATLKIIIKPLFWQTWWFRLTLLAVLLSASLLFTHLRSRNLRKQKGLLEKAVEERTEELQKSNRELNEHQQQIVARNEEIQSQKEEIILQRDEIHMKNEELSQSYEKIKILSDFGKQLTATLNLESINDMIFNYVSSLIDTSVFGIGIYEKESNSIKFAKLIEKNQPIAAFSSFLDDSTSCAAWCFKNQSLLMSNDFENEYMNFITELMIRSSSVPKSLIYIPLTVMDKQIGIMTVQSYHPNAYTEKDLTTLQTLATYVAIALDNAAAYDIVKSQFSELERHRHELELLIQERTIDLEKAKEKAEESDKLKSAFLANMSHEIRTPLNAIVGFVNLLDEDQIQEDEKREFYQIIQSNGFTLLNLINDIIDFSKIEAGQMDISLSEIRLDKLFNEIYHIYSEEVRRLNQMHNIQIMLNSDFMEKLPVMVSDYVRLKQIFCNLINNSIKFTREGIIEFGIKEISEKGKISFFVKDTGIGIEKKNFKIIFDRFRKIEDDKMTLYRGTGLGLSITKYLVERLGGEIWLDSEVGKGSVFVFSLPLTVVEEIPAHKVTRITSTGLPIPNWSKKGVLVVEDESSNFLVLDSMLKKTNIEIFWAKNGEEAIEIYKKNLKKINMILMDIKLPKMDGFEAAEEIRKINETVPIVAQTAYALPREEHLIRQESFDDYLSKPIVRDKLIRVMSQFLS